MNKFYRVVWNAKTSCWQAVSEIAKSHIKNTRSQVIGQASAIISIQQGTMSLVLLSLSMSVAAALHEHALPSGQQVMSGQAQFHQSGHVLNIQQQSQHLSTQWNSFNIGREATVNFQQPNASSVALNRVIDNNASQIMGRLNANGQVFLINPNGVVFSKQAQVNVGGLVASSLDLQHADVEKGKFSFVGNGQGSIENHGHIQTSSGGTVALIAPVVKNTGRIHADNGRVQLSAADQVRIHLQNGSLVSFDVDQGTLQGLVDNGGAIIADNGVVHLTATASQHLGRAVVNHNGYIQANRLSTNSKGEIVLLGDMAQGSTQVSGQLVSEGKQGQAGGLIETSAAVVNISDTAQISTQAEAGAKTGQWLIDPVDFVVGQNGNMTGAALSAALNNTDITIQTTATQSSVAGQSGSTHTSPQGKGDISIEDAVKWDSGKTLTLDAHNDIYINNVIDASQGAGGKLELKYGQQSATGQNGEVYDPNWDANVPSYADYHVQAPIHLQQGQNFSIQQGSDAQNRKDFEVITDVSQLQQMNQNLSGYYALGANIDASQLQNFNPIGSAPTEGKSGDQPAAAFTGAFDGLGHVIDGLKVHAPVIGQGQGSNLGMFGRIEDADIRNIGLTNASVNGNEYIGGLVGSMINSRVSNSFVTGQITGRGYVGGLVGAGYFSQLDQVYSAATVNSDYIDNGLVGDIYDIKVKQAFALNADGTANVWDSEGQQHQLAADQLKQKDSYSQLNWKITDRAGESAAWRIYEGQSGPLLKAFLTPLMVKADNYETVYNGQWQNSQSYHVQDGADLSKVLGTAQFTGGRKNAGQSTSQVSGLYSDQTGYDLEFVDGQVQINRALISSVEHAVANKTYDGDTRAYLTGTGQAIGVFGQDDVRVIAGDAAFLDKHAADGKTVYLYNVGLSGADAENYDVAAEITTTANITPLEIVFIDGIQAQDKSYDGSVNAQIDQSNIKFAGQILGDQLELNADAEFEDKNAGVDKNVLINNLQLAGADAGNYKLSDALTQSGTLTSATIHQANIQIASGLKAQNKVYDATLNAALDTQNIQFSGLIGTDQVGLTGQAQFADKNAGLAKTVQLQDLSLTGTDAANYQLIWQPIELHANIDKASIHLGQWIAKHKVYDGTTAAEVDFSQARLNGVQQNDQVAVTGGTAAFSDRHAGQSKTVTLTGLELAGADANNYILSSSVSTSTANIQQKIIKDTSGFGSIVKTYDGTVTAPLLHQATETSDAIQGDNLVLVASGASFGNKDAGVNKIVRLHDLELLGADAANYRLDTNAEWYQGTIQKALIGDIQGLTAHRKVYDGTRDVVLNTDFVKLGGQVWGDSLALNIDQAAFVAKDAGQDRQVAVSGLSLTGQDAHNYELLPQQLTLFATIDKAKIQNISGLTALNKVYDSTTKAQIDTRQAVLDGYIAGDNLGLSATAIFDDKHAGSNKNVHIQQLELLGSDALNYEIDLINPLPTYTANISQAKINTINGLFVESKIYDGTTLATVNTSQADFFKYDGDDLKLNSIAHYADKNVGDHKAVDMTLQLLGADAQNYSLAELTPIHLTGQITPKALQNIAGIIAKSKVYDGKTDAELNLSSVQYDGLIEGDDIVLSDARGAFENAAVGTGKTVKISDLQLGGADAANYQVANLNLYTKADIHTHTSLSEAAKLSQFPINGNAGELPLETLLLEIQSQRASLLDNQLKQQLADVNARNESVAKMNSALTLLKALEASFTQPAGNETSKTVKGNKALEALYTQYLAAYQAMGVTTRDFPNLSTLFKDGVLKLSDLQRAMSELQSSIDVLSNTQRMDLLRLQSISSKQNEAFDLMTNFIKKMNDSRSSVFGNMTGGPAPTPSDQPPAAQPPSTQPPSQPVPDANNHSDDSNASQAALEKLRAMGIMSDATTEGEQGGQKITRQDFAIILAKALDLDNSTASSSSGYRDGQPQSPNPLTEQDIPKLLNALGLKNDGSIQTLTQFKDRLKKIEGLEEFQNSNTSNSERIAMQEALSKFLQNSGLQQLGNKKAD